MRGSRAGESAGGTTLVVVNPMSGGGRTGRQWPQLRAALHRAGIDFEYRLTAARGEAIELTRDGLRAGAVRVVAVGGDGTLSEVVNGFFDEEGQPIAPDAAVGMVPSGTGGDFRRSAGIPATAATAAALLARGDRRLVDVGRIEYGEGAQPRLRHFLNIADCGIGGEVVSRVERGRRLGSPKLTFLYHSVAAMLSFPGRAVRVTVDADVRERRLSGVVVANGRYFGGSMLIAPNADCADGVFDVVLLDALPRWRHMVEIRHVYSGTHLGRSGVEVLRGRTVTVTPLEDRPALFDVDGEQVGRAPATLTCLPSAIRLCAPNRSAATC